MIPATPSFKGEVGMVRLLLAAVGALTAAVLMVGGAGASSGTTGSGCIAHRPAYIEDVFEPSYTAGCSGHDEPELDPISAAPGSATNMTWRFVLPTDGAVPVSAVGPTFWFGGTVTDPNPKDFFGEGFLEVQFYPDGILTNCTAERRLRAQPRAERVHRVLAGLVDPHDRPEAGVPRAGGVQRDADDRSKARAARHARGRHDRLALPPRQCGRGLARRRDSTRRRTRAAPSS